MPKPRSRSVRQELCRLTAVVVALLMTGTACKASGSSGAARSAEGGDTRGVVWAKTAEADSLDPTIAGNAMSWELLNLAYEGLLTVGDGLKVEPQLAESWKQPSPTTYEFTLRKGVKFSNGRELTVDDVVGSLQRLLDNAEVAVWAGQLGTVRSIEAVGDRQVRIVLKEPRMSFPAALAGGRVLILPMKELREGSFDPKKELLGTGPFKVASHIQGESWVLDRNPHYWRPGLPKVDKVTVRVMTDDAARTAALRDGSVDITTFERPDSLELLKGQAGVSTAVQQTTDYYRLDVNAKSSVFSDARLRQALALTIDRDRIRDVALGGVGRATAAVSPSFEGVCDPATVPFGRPDLQRAKALVDEAGAAGKTVEIIAPPIFPMASPIAQVLQQNLQSVGLKARIVALDFGEVTRRAYSGTAKFDLILSWFAGYADPAMVLTWWHPTLGGFTKSYLRPDTRLGGLIDQSFSTAPGPQRDRILRQTCDRIAEDANIIPLVSKDAIIAYRSDQLDAPIPKVEGYAQPLRRIAEFSTR
jgi:peptide/nickel transport system substrate-binding protein